jgi:integrase
MHLPLLIGLKTGQRDGDILRLTWSAYDGAAIRLKQRKGQRRARRRIRGDRRHSASGAAQGRA